MALCSTLTFTFIFTNETVKNVKRQQALSVAVDTVKQRECVQATFENAKSHRRAHDMRKRVRQAQSVVLLLLTGGLEFVTGTTWSPVCLP